MCTCMIVHYRHASDDDPSEPENVTGVPAKLKFAFDGSRRKLADVVITVCDAIVAADVVMAVCDASVVDHVHLTLWSRLLMPVL